MLGCEIYHNERMATKRKQKTTDTHIDLDVTKHLSNNCNAILHLSIKCIDDSFSFRWKHWKATTTTPADKWWVNSQKLFSTNSQYSCSCCKILLLLFTAAVAASPFWFGSSKTKRNDNFFFHRPRCWWCSTHKKQFSWFSVTAFCLNISNIQCKLYTAYLKTCVQLLHIDFWLAINCFPECIHLLLLLFGAVRWLLLLLMHSFTCVS